MPKKPTEKPKRVSLYQLGKGDVSGPDARKTMDEYASRQKDVASTIVDKTKKVGRFARAVGKKVYDSDEPLGAFEADNLRQDFYMRKNNPEMLDKIDKDSASRDDNKYLDYVDRNKKRNEEVKSRFRDIFTSKKKEK